MTHVLDTIQGETLEDKIEWLAGSLFLVRESIPMALRRAPHYSEAWDAIMAAEEALAAAAEHIVKGRISTHGEDDGA